MLRNLRRLAAALLPFCFLSAQQPNPQSPQPAKPTGFRQPSPEVMRRMAELRRRTQERANAINDLAGRIQSPEDADKLVDLVAAEFSDELPPKWATRSIRDRLAHAEYDTASGALIPEQHVADVWNDFLEKIGAPPESYVTAAEIHTLRDSEYVSSQFFWARGNQTVWTVSHIYALGPDGKVANGCRALEALNVFWQLAMQPELLDGAREMIRKGQKLSDLINSPSQPPKPGAEHARVVARMAPPNPIQQAANRYIRDHGMGSMNHAVEDLLKHLLAG